MAKKPRRSVRPASRADLAKMQEHLAACEERIADLERAVDINIKRMASMQAEIDHLRARSQT
jgi:hypothetical protein